MTPHSPPAWEIRRRIEFQQNCGHVAPPGTVSPSAWCSLFHCAWRCPSSGDSGVDHGRGTPNESSPPPAQRPALWPATSASTIVVRPVRHGDDVDVIAAPPRSRSTCRMAQVITREYAGISCGSRLRCNLSRRIQIALNALPGHGALVKACVFNGNRGLDRQALEKVHLIQIQIASCRRQRKPVSVKAAPRLIVQRKISAPPASADSCPQAPRRSCFGKRP